MAESENQGEAPITIKKYANRRLYNTATSSYVTLEHLCEMVKEGREFVVYDAKTGEDITRSVLAQIIFEEENKGQNLLPTNFLRQLIRFYGGNMEAMVPKYLEMSMEAFARNQEQLRTYMSGALGETNPFRQMEEMGRQNMAVFQQALSMFTPFANGSGTPEQQGEAKGAPAAPEQKPAAAGDDLDDLRQQLLRMQRRLDRLDSDKPGGED